MKNNTLFLVVMLSLLIVGLGALYYQYQMGELELGSRDLNTTPAPTVVVTQDGQEVDTAQDETQAQEKEQEQMPPLSTDDDLDTIQKELGETVILEEDFSDLE